MLARVDQSRFLTCVDRRFPEERYKRLMNLVIRDRIEDDMDFRRRNDFSDRIFDDDGTIIGRKILLSDDVAAHFTISRTAPVHFTNHNLLYTYSLEQPKILS